MTEVLSDLVVVGGGPAGLSAAIYAARAGLHVIVLEKQGFGGGQMATTPEIENYPGFARTDGFALAEAMTKHAAGLGAEYRSAAVTALCLEPGNLSADTADCRYRTKTLILAMGARRKTLDIPGEKEYTGRGVSYCAVCDGAFFRGKSAAVVGGGETALEDALYLAGLSCSVTLIHRRDTFRGSQKAQSAVREHSGITLLTPYKPVEIIGNGTVTGLRLRHAENGEERTLSASGLFVCVGTAANTELLDGLLPLNADGRVATGEDCATGIPGVFAVGDLRTKPLYQVVTAAADGAVAAMGCARFIEGG